jgi:hypothetical protein
MALKLPASRNSRPLLNLGKARQNGIKLAAYLHVRLETKQTLDVQME